MRNVQATAAVAALLAAAPAGAQESAAGLAEAFTGGTVHVGFRYRIESVEEDAFDQDAFASTLRSRLTYATKPLAGFTFGAEVDDVRHVGADHFNDSRNGVTDRPAVTDPEGTDLNQAWLRYEGLPGTAVTAGRQRIERANLRHVGGVAWRQNEQTFDAVQVANRFADGKGSASWAWIGQVNRIQGPDDGTPPADLDSNTHLLDASWAFAPALTVAAYGYLMDFDDADTLSNRTIGVRATGGVPVGGEWKLGYAAEFARQDDDGDNPVDYEADYGLLEVSIGTPALGFKAGYEVLEGSSTPGGSFRTPLATLHVFQGWADKFLNTPDGGIEDVYVAVSGKALGADLLLRFHDFSAETGGGDWGREVDASANWPVGKHYAVLLKAASYDADDLSTDTTKLWLMATASF